jgi:DNA replication protein DnaC
MKPDSPMKNTTQLALPIDNLPLQLEALKLLYFQQHHQGLATQAASEHWSHVEYLARLAEGEAHRREDQSIKNRVKAARFPMIKTLDDFDWNWPKKINRAQIQNLFRLNFVEDNANAIFLGPVGVGKSHIAIALGYAACLKGYSVLWTSAVDIINTMAAAQGTRSMKHEMKKYLKPRVLAIDELGYLPIDKQGADALFQIISHRYERGALIVTSNRAYKHWPETFNNDSTLTSALLDRVLHHAHTALIEGKSFRMKDQIEG